MSAPGDRRDRRRRRGRPPGALWLSSLADRRPGRSAARGLPRPARRTAAQEPRGRARAVPRRGREGRPPRGRGRLPAAVVPDGAALARRARRRAVRHGRAVLRDDRDARRAGHRLPRAPRRAGVAGAEAAAVAWSVLEDARSILVLEDIVDHTNVGAIFRSGAALGFDAVLLAPRCADPLYRRSIKVAMGAVFTMPWTRLDDWFEALPVPVRAGLHHGGADPGRRRRRHRATPSPASTRWPWCSAPRATGCPCAGSRWPTAARSSRWRAGIDSLNVAAATAVACYVTSHR